METHPFRKGSLTDRDKIRDIIFKLDTAKFQTEPFSNLIYEKRSNDLLTYRYMNFLLNQLVGFFIF